MVCSLLDFSASKPIIFVIVLCFNVKVSIEFNSPIRLMSSAASSSERLSWR
jgi:hypothetical protein